MNGIAQRDSASIQAVRRYWNRHVDDWKIARSPSGSREFFDEVEAYRFEKLHYLPQRVNFAAYRGSRVLDVGCGLGTDLARFAAHGADVVGVDLAERAVDLARANFEQRGLAGEFLQMNGERMGLPSQSFDFVYCHTVLQFTPDPRRMVQEIQRILKPAGRAMLMVINRSSWLMLLHGMLGTEIDYLDSPVYHRSSAAEFQRLLTPFARARIIPERFPVPTKVHHGLKARLYNGVFVRSFSLLPHRWVAWTGHHLLAFVTRGSEGDGLA